MTFHDTTGWEAGMIRAVDHMGHGHHGGWYEAGSEEVICQCGVVLAPSVGYLLNADELLEVA